MNKKSPSLSIRESRNPPKFVTLSYFLAIIPSNKSTIVPRNAAIASTYQPFTTKTKNKRGGILPMRVSTFGLIEDKGSIKGSRNFSIIGFLLVSMNRDYKIDLHTHSILSHDGGITKQQYIDILGSGILDYIAITDHNETGFARILQKELGDKIIVGEEIKTTDGEIIGLFLTKTIAPGLSAKNTIDEIHSDGGVVYIPHPFESSRHSMQDEIIGELLKEIDIIEVFNGRGILRGKSQLAMRTADFGNKAVAASSDAHCRRGMGITYSKIFDIPEKNSLTDLLKSGTLQKIYAPWYSLLCPSVNRIKNKFIL